MKYLINLFVIFIVSLTVYVFYGLIQSNNERIREKEIADSLAISKQDRFNAFVKSIGTLSFYDIKLGSSFTKTVKEIQRNNNFKCKKEHYETFAIFPAIITRPERMPRRASQEPTDRGRSVRIGDFPLLQRRLHLV